MIGWQEAKWSYDYRKDQPIILHGNNANTAHLYAHDAADALHKATDNGLEFSKRLIQLFVREYQDFGVVFYGGSWENPGLFKTMDEFLKEIEPHQTTDRCIRLSFLGDNDSLWATGVSVGVAATACLLDAHPPFQVFGSSALGIQEENQVDGKWLCKNEVPVILRAAGGNLPTVLIHATEDFRDKRYVLLCDPAYPANASSPITIVGKRPEGQLPPYNLGWLVNRADLPLGRLSFKFIGRVARALTMRPPLALNVSSVLYLFLVCHKLGFDNKPQYDTAAKGWKLPLRTDGVSLLLAIDGSEVEEYPLWCTNYRGQMPLGKIYECSKCRAYTRWCEQCYDVYSDQHRHENFREIGVLDDF
ncbi:hypothetical protein PG991_001759 [Apiospora marii]|uniref:Uncharacterized protein n=1 Tax=Apiospora marii TaxID=335849 RepID=A0ABR1SQZ3_9PEZI